MYGIVLPGRLAVVKAQDFSDQPERAAASKSFHDSSDTVKC